MIDWKFIGSLEGSSLAGYVPDAQNSGSGVTIATGVDIAAMPSALFYALPDALRAKFAPYRNLIGFAALHRLHLLPLTITEEEAEEVNELVQSAATETLAKAYETDAEEKFSTLPDAAQTVIASVAFQYGNVAVRCPKFWKAAIQQDWKGMQNELLNFGDSYPSRRKKEATYLGTLTNDEQNV
jgi:GH24 family phage-related lysozyme (muramidase)